MSADLRHQVSAVSIHGGGAEGKAGSDLFARVPGPDQSENFLLPFCQNGASWSDRIGRCTDQDCARARAEVLLAARHPGNSILELMPGAFRVDESINPSL